MCFVFIVEIGTMEPTVVGGAIGHKEFAIEGLGLVFDDVYLDIDGGGDKFEEVERRTELDVEGYFEAPDTTSVAEPSDSLRISIGSIKQ